MSLHQIEFKMLKHHLFKDALKALFRPKWWQAGSSKRNKKTIKEGGKYENQHENIWKKYVPLAQKSDKIGEYPLKSKSIRSV